jgi:FRG domain
MRGQWLGSYSGAVAGKLMINVDEVDDHFEAVAYLIPSTTDVPASVAYLKTQNKESEQVATAYIYPIDPRTNFQGKWEEIKPLYGEGVVHSSEANITLRVQENKLHVDGVSNIGVTFSAVLDKPSDRDESKIQGRKMSWNDFKLHISSISKFNYLFRGQQKPWSLCTSFHRRGRYRMSEFISKDVKQLHQRLSAITTHFFDLTVPDQNGAFFNLLQHHGYPTPLLDWSHSPYVAAFFAFRDRPIGYDGEEVVRIYVFNNQEWQNRYRQIQNLDPPFPHLSVMEFIAIDNPRLVPQQSVTTVTNLHDIEAYVLSKEYETGVRFLDAIDIPANEREVAMRELRFMGITAGSMFPSIDGVCEELRERNFDQ